MSWLRQIPPPPKIRFLGEQDGPIEQELKYRWRVVLLQHPQVKSAYLARAQYRGERDARVILCIAGPKVNEVELLEELIPAFRELFNSKESLDMKFLTDEQEKDVAKVCRPFYPSP